VGQTVDYTVHDLGTMWQIVAHTTQAREWVQQFVGEIPDYMGNHEAFYGDWRPMREIARGMRDAGLAGAGLPWHTDENARWPGES